MHAIIMWVGLTSIRSWKPERVAQYSKEAPAVIRLLRVIVDHKRVCRRRQKRAAVRGLGVLARCLVSGGHDDYSRHS